jgi:hypothetical protein
MHGHHEQGLLSVAMPRPGRPGREQEASQMLYRVSIGYARPCLLRFPFCPISIDGSWSQRHGCHLIDGKSEALQQAGYMRPNECSKT